MMIDFILPLSDKTSVLYINVYTLYVLDKARGSSVSL